VNSVRSRNPSEFTIPKQKSPSFLRINLSLIQNFLIFDPPAGICPNISKKQRYDNGHGIGEEQVGISSLLEHKKIGLGG